MAGVERDGPEKRDLARPASLGQELCYVARQVVESQAWKV